MNPEYFKENVELFVGLAPLAHIGYIANSHFRAMAEVYPAFEIAVQLTETYGIYNFEDKDTFMNSKFCQIVPLFCYKFDVGFDQLGS